MKRSKTPNKEYLGPPLLVMNSFTSPPPPNHPADKPHHPPPHETLLISMFQNLFPAISAQHTPISSIRRVLLLNRISKTATKDLPEDARSGSDYLIDLRHYTITTRPVGLSRAVKRLNAAEKIISNQGKGKGSVPNLGRLEDISEFMLDPGAAASGYTSESEVEEDAEVEVLPGAMRAKNPTKRKRAAGISGGTEKHAVKLTEIGPRMKLELVKIEEGLADGKVLHHEFLKKTKEEEKELEKRWEEKQGKGKKKKGAGRECEEKEGRNGSKKKKRKGG